MTQIKLLKWKADDKRKSWLFLIWTFSFMLCMFAPLEIFFTNRTEFWFSLTQILPIFLIVFGVVGLVFSFGGWYIHDKKVGMYVYGFLLCTLLYFYVQGNYVPREYGVLDGADIDWSSYVFYGVISIVLILVFFIAWIAICLKIREKIYSIGMGICIVLGLTQLVTVGTLYIQNYLKAGEISNNIVVTEKDILKLSRDNNILVFVLDSFDSFVMSDMVERDDGESYKELFENFTYYPDTLGAYPTTKGALPQILTGKWYKNDKPYIDYLNEAYHNNKLYSTLQENNYSVGIYTSYRYLGENSDLFINVEKGKYTIKDYGTFINRMSKLVAFNYMPHQIKKFFVMDTLAFDELKESISEYDTYLTDVQDFYKRLNFDKITFTENVNCFRFYHIDGIHVPYTFDKNLDSRKNEAYEVYDEAAGNFTLLKVLFESLKEEGIYDNTSIVIMADHGYTGYDQNPLFMIKNAGHNQKFTVSDKKMTYDYLADIFSALAMGIEVNEEYIDSLKTDDIPRKFILYSWDNSWNREYLPEMLEYICPEDARDYTGMMITGNVYRAESDEAGYLYKLGEKLSFMEEDTAAAYLLYGFAANEEKLTWTNGIKTAMLFEVQEEYSNLTLTMEYTTMGSQHVIISANGNEVADYQAMGAEEKSITIPGEYVKNGKLMLTFEFPEASSPASQGISSDERILALAIKTLTISAAD